MVEIKFFYFGIVSFMFLNDWSYGLVVGLLVGSVYCDRYGWVRVFVVVIRVLVFKFNICFIKFIVGKNLNSLNFY